MSPYTPQNTHNHVNISTSYIPGFLHQCIYTLQHILERGSFYFACIEILPSTLLSHCNTCRIKHLDYDLFLNAFFPRFQLIMHVFTFTFYRFFCHKERSEYFPIYLIAYSTTNLFHYCMIPYQNYDLLYMDQLPAFACENL